MSAPAGSGSRRRRPIRRTSTAARSAMRSSARPARWSTGTSAPRHPSGGRNGRRRRVPAVAPVPRAPAAGPPRPRCRSSMPIEHPPELAPQSVLTRPSTRTKPPASSSGLTSVDGRATRIAPLMPSCPTYPRLSVVDREDRPADRRTIPVGWPIRRGEDRRPRVAGQPARPAARRTRGAGHSFGIHAALDDHQLSVEPRNRGGELLREPSGSSAALACGWLERRRGRGRRLARGG